MNKLKNRLISAACAAAMLFSSVGNSILHTTAVADEATTAVTEQADNNDTLRQQSFELHPNSENSGQIIKLNGLMPEGAEAEAVDVSDDYDG